MGGAVGAVSVLLLLLLRLLLLSGPIEYFVRLLQQHHTAQTAAPKVSLYLVSRVQLFCSKQLCATQTSLAFGPRD